jgi:hypothetical protein
LKLTEHEQLVGQFADDIIVCPFKHWINSKRVETMKFNFIFSLFIIISIQIIWIPFFRFNFLLSYLYFKLEIKKKVIHIFFFS